MSESIGLIEVQGYSVALAVMDKACKAANITITGIDVNNPSQGDKAQIPVVVQVKFIGNISDVQMALQVGEQEAMKYLDKSSILTHFIPSSMKELHILLSDGKVRQK